MFTKLDHALLTSSIWGEDPVTCKVWITLLASSNQHGNITATIPGLARIAGLTNEQVEDAIERFQQPDPYSRTPDEEGRRIKRIDGGWHLINHARYRDSRNTEERREYKRLKQREYRAKAKGKRVDRNVDNGGQGRPRKTYTDTDTDTDTEKDRTSASTGVEVRGQFDEFWAGVPTRRGKKAAKKAWDKAIKDGAAPEQIIAGLKTYQRYERRRATQADYRPLHPSTWLNQGRWDDEEPDTKKQVEKLPPPPTIESVEPDAADLAAIRQLKAKIAK